jgi:CTP synthase (UTP-ammonia lyase)
MCSPTLAIIGDHDPAKPSHLALDRVLDHLPYGITASWLATDAIGEPGSRLGSVDGLWIAPGSPYHSTHGALAAIRYAREHELPLFGT